ncbi:ABC transporter substrate-binding protein [Georgenia sp. AZ-5]|uniref:ABC transporter substrate-binding protein n=1 Tax=Georgenia sp. AZ-5 TaxID=3367526 RepID=UPI0037545D02
MKHPARVVPALLLGSALTLSACTGEPSAKAGTDSDDQVVTIATQRQPHLFAPYVYEQFAPEGVTIEVVPMANSTDEMNAVLTGDVDFALMGVPTVISGVAQGEDITLVASGADGGSGLIGDPSIASAADLAGKRVGYVPGSSQEIALRLTLEAAGVDPDADVELVSLGYADMADALARGDIDAYAGAEVNTSISLLDGATEVASIYDTPIGRVNIGLATSASLAEEDPALVQQIVDTHAAAVEHLLQNPDAWVSGVQEQFSFDEAVLDQAIQNIWLRSDLDGEYLTQVGELADQMVALGTIGEAPAAEDVITTEFVAE